jgi:hypothetical protein
MIDPFKVVEYFAQRYLARVMDQSFRSLFLGNSFLVVDISMIIT